VPHDDPFAGKKVSGDWAYNLDRATSFTPTLTASSSNPNLGTGGTATGYYHRNGHLITVWVNITFGSSGTSAGSGTYSIAQPVAADSSLYAPSWGLGSIFLVDADTAANRDLVVVEYITATTVRMRPNKLTGTLVTHAVPFGWTANDNLFGSWSYLADPALL
jgi:hypothetical protein